MSMTAAELSILRRLADCTAALAAEVRTIVNDGTTDERAVAQLEAKLDAIGDEVEYLGAIHEPVPEPKW
jgi:hypothetical protein